MITVAQLKTYLKIVTSDKDAFLQTCIDRAVADVENYCNRKFTSGSYTQYSNGDNSNELFIKNYPVNSVTSLEWFDGFDEWNDILDSPDVPADSLFIISDINKIKLIKGYFFTNGCNNIKVVYTAGWASGMAVDDIKAVLLEIASTHYRNSADSGDAILGKSSVNLNSAASESATYVDLTDNWKKRLKKYKISNY